MTISDRYAVLPSLAWGRAHPRRDGPRLMLDGSTPEEWVQCDDAPTKGLVREGPLQSDGDAEMDPINTD